MVPRVSRWRPLGRFRVQGMLLAGTLAAAGACTLLVDADPQQCRGDGDCAAFTGTSCDLGRHVCVPSVGHGADAGATTPSVPEADASFCPPDGSPAPGLELLNACTDATCVPFDNRTRLHNLAGDGSLKPLPDPGGMVPP